MEGLLMCIPEWRIQGHPYQRNGPAWVLGRGGCRVGLQHSQEQGKVRGNLPAQPGASQTRSKSLKEADSNQLVSGSLLRYCPNGSFFQSSEGFHSAARCAED